MKFFIPGIEDRFQAERLYKAVRDFVEDVCQAEVDRGRRIARLSYQHGGEAFELEVGDRHPQLDEPVMAIFADSNPERFFVCTPTRGMLETSPFVVGSLDNEFRLPPRQCGAIHAEDFEGR